MRIVWVLIGLATSVFLAVGGCGKSAGGISPDSAAKFDSPASMAGSFGGGGGKAGGGDGGTGRSLTGGSGGNTTSGAGGGSALDAPAAGGTPGRTGGAGGISMAPGGAGGSTFSGKGGNSSAGGSVTSGGTAGSGGVTSAGGIRGTGGYTWYEPPTIPNCDGVANYWDSTVQYKCTGGALSCPKGPQISCCGQSMSQYTCSCENFQLIRCVDNSTCSRCVDTGID